MTGSESLHIVYVSHEFPPQIGGGIGTAVAALSGAMAARGHRVTVLTLDETGAPGAGDHAAAPPGVRVVRMPPSRPPEGLAPQQAAAWCWLRRGEQVAAYLEGVCADGGADVVEFADYRAEGLVYLERRRHGQANDRPVCLIRLHTPLAVLARYNRGQPRRPELEEMELRAMMLCDGLICPSAVLGREVQAFGKARRLPPMQAAPPVADAAFLLNGTGQDRVEWNSGEILYVGRLEERKGVQELIEAAPRVLRSCPGATIHLVGGDTAASEAEPSMRAVLERRMATWPAELQARVMLHGPLDRAEVRRRYLRAQVCVLPSLFECGPYTCLEAMGLGRVVLGTDNSGMAEMIEPGISGQIARSGDVDDLADKLIDLFRMPEPARRQMGEAARRRVLERYHPCAGGAGRGGAAANEAVYLQAINLQAIKGRERFEDPRLTNALTCDVGTVPTVSTDQKPIQPGEDREPSVGGALWQELQAAAAERERLLATSRQQLERIGELEALRDRLWAELQRTSEDRTRYLSEARRLAVEWERAARRVRECEQRDWWRQNAARADVQPPRPPAPLERAGVFRRVLGRLRAVLGQRRGAA